MTIRLVNSVNCPPSQKLVITPTVEPGFARKERIARFKEDCYKLAAFVKTEQGAKEHLEKRILGHKQVPGNSVSFPKSELIDFRDSTKARLKG